MQPSALYDGKTFAVGRNAEIISGIFRLTDGESDRFAVRREEIRLFSPAVVKNGLKALEMLEIDELRSEALRRNLRTDNGDPVHFLLDYTLDHLKYLREFWREAAKANEGIISETG